MAPQLCTTPTGASKTRHTTIYPARRGVYRGICCGVCYPCRVPGARQPPSSTDGIWHISGWQTAAAVMSVTLLKSGDKTVVSVTPQTANVKCVVWRGVAFLFCPCDQSKVTPLLLLLLLPLLQRLQLLMDILPFFLSFNSQQTETVTFVLLIIVSWQTW